MTSYQKNLTKWRDNRIGEKDDRSFNSTTELGLLSANNSLITSHYKLSHQTPKTNWQSLLRACLILTMEGMVGLLLVTKGYDWPMTTGIALGPHTSVQTSLVAAKELTQNLECHRICKLYEK